MLRLFTPCLAIISLLIGMAVAVIWVRSCAHAEYIERKAWAVNDRRLCVSEYRLCWSHRDLQLYIRPQVIADAPTVTQLVAEFQRDHRPSTMWNAGQYERPLESLESWARRHAATTTHCCGIGLWRQRYTPAWGDTFTYTTVFMPCWLIIALAAVLPLNWLRKKITHGLLLRRRRARGQCLQCGYDLRASTGRCPECGTPIGSPMRAGALTS